MSDWLDSFNTRRIESKTYAKKIGDEVTRDPWPWLDELLEWNRRNSERPTVTNG